MQTKSWALAAAFAFALSGVSAEPQRPRIYYPRQVRRQLENNTDAETTSTKRQLLDGVLDPILGGGNDDTPKSTTPSRDGPEDSGILVGPTGIVIPGLIGDDDDNENDNGNGNGGNNGTATATGGPNTRPEPEPTSSKGGGLLDPIVDPLPTLISDVLGPGSSKTSTSKTAPPATTSAGDEDGDEDENNESSKTGEPSAPKPTSSKGGGLLDPIVDPLPTLISNVLPGPSKSKTEDPKPTGGNGNNGTDPEPTREPTRDPPTPTSSKGGILDPIVDPLPTLITDLLPGPSKEPENPGNGTEPTSSTPGNIVTDILPSLTLFPPEETTTPSPPTEPSESSKPPLIPTDILPPILPDPTETTSEGTPGPTEGPGNGTTTDVPTPIPTPTPGPGDSTSISLPPPGDSTSIDLPPPVNETSAPPPDSQTTPTVLPTETNTPVPTPIPTPSSAPEPSSPSLPPQSPPSETVIPTSKPPKPPVTSIEPTATYSNSDEWMPTSIAADPSSFTFVPPTGTKPDTSSTGLPTDIPKVIMPNNPKVKRPEGTKEIRIGFKQPMHYKHVAKTPVAAAQIFMYLPEALSYAGDFKIDNVEVYELVPEDTEYKWGYITTIAKVYYPESQIDKLQTDLWEPSSDLYNHPDALVRDLTVDINPDIDIFGNITDGDDEKDDKEPEDEGNSNDALDSGNDGSSSAKEAATKAGIAVGAFGLAALYGGAMFIVARRYKRKRQGHRRTSSLSGSEASSEMQYTNNGSPAMMGGALMSQDMSSYGGVGNRERDSNGSGPSARTANISAPVATENSLGWN